MLVLFGNANKLGGKEAKNYITHDKFTIILDTVTGDGSKSSLTKNINFPTGFNNNNCVIISAMAQNVNSQIGAWGTGTVFSSSNYTTGALPLKATISKNGVGIEIKNITFTNGQSPEIYNISGTFNYIIVLMRID